MILPQDLKRNSGEWHCIDCEHNLRKQGIKYDPHTISICEHCGIEFKQKTRYQRFCCYECSVKHKERKVIVKCVICGKQCETKSYRKDTFKVCSKECYSEYFSRIFDASKDKRIRNLKHKWETDESFRQKMAEKNKLLFTGENHPNYNHSTTDDERQVKRAYTEYRQWRTQVYEKDNYICQCCGQRGGQLNAHHVFNYSNYPELRTEVSNGITMCKKCHLEFHSIYGKKNNTDTQLTDFLIAKSA